MKTMYESLVWHEVKLTGHAAARTIPLMWGEVGSGAKLVTMIAGTHGDEGPWSALAIKQLLQHPVSELKGQIRVIFTANAMAAEVNARNAWIDSPNGFDLDSCFPGNPDGSHTERVAAAITPLFADSNVIIDLHGGGSWCVNAFVKRFAGSESIAEDMEAPFISNAPNKPGGLTSYAKTLGIQVTNIEVGGRSRDEMLWCSRIVKGLERVLYNLDVLALAEKPVTAKKAIDVIKIDAIRSRMGGIFVPTLREDAVGTIMPAGTEMGKILDLHTLEELEVFTAPYAKTAMMLMRPEICVVEGSALIYVIAEPVL